MLDWIIYIQWFAIVAVLGALTYAFFRGGFRSDVPRWGMAQWRNYLQLFFMVMGFAGLGALVSLALLAVKFSVFTVDHGYLPLLGALWAGALAVGLRIGIDALRKP